ncbi:hypothetical protein D3C76_623620 [compost metagenome]
MPSPCSLATLPRLSITSLRWAASVSALSWAAACWAVSISRSLSVSRVVAASTVWLRASARFGVRVLAIRASALSRTSCGSGAAA